jgi:hypothetical protein
MSAASFSCIPNEIFRSVHYTPHPALEEDIGGKNGTMRRRAHLQNKFGKAFDKKTSKVPKKVITFHRFKRRFSLQ